MKKKVIATIILGSLTSTLYAGGDIGGVVFNQDNDLNIVVPTEAVVPKVEKVEVISVPKVEKKVLPEVKAVEVSKAVNEESDNSKGFYGVVKALTIFGTTLHGHTTKPGYGMACDVGYRFGNGFETEVDIGYATNKLDNAAGDKASYISSSWGLIYGHPITEKISIFGKGGVVYEKERISVLDIDESDTGFVYSGGLEYNLSPSTTLVLELESSTIDTLAGNTLSIGYMFDF